MASKKELKKELRENIRLVLYCQEQHDSYDHELGSDDTCMFCVNYLKLKKYVQIIEAKLAAFRTEEEKRFDFEAEESQQEPFEPTRRTSKDPYFFIGEYKGEPVVLRVSSLSGVKKEYPGFKGNRLTQEDVQQLFISTGENTFCELGKLTEEFGVVAKQVSADHKKNCRYRYSDEFLLYTGENHDQVIAFCEGTEAFRTKKKNKIQINGHRGSVSVSPEEYLVKNKLKHIMVYTEDEFRYLYEREKVSLWVEA